jgi:hypothetical protein
MGDCLSAESNFDQPGAKLLDVTRRSQSLANFRSSISRGFEASNSAIIERLCYFDQFFIHRVNLEIVPALRE